MLRRLHSEQPDSFAFTPENQAWAQAQITKYPEGRQASAIIPLLWRAQEQEGWLSKPAIEYVAKMLDMAYIRVLEVTSFYFMFQMQPVGSIAHIQVCGTLSCMICGAEDLIAVCKEKIAPKAHMLSADGKLAMELILDVESHGLEPSPYPIKALTAAKEALEAALGVNAKMTMLPMQPGDVPATAADTSELGAWAGFRPDTPVREGVKRFADWYLGHYGRHAA